MQYTVLIYEVIKKAVSVEGDIYKVYSPEEKLHTTDLGAVRIKKNLSINADNLVLWCKVKIQDENAVIIRKGKNWYIDIEDYQITVNAYSYTIITAHKVRL